MTDVRAVCSAFTHARLVHTATNAEPPLPVAQARALLDPPGGILMWLVVGLELGAFALIFLVIAHLRGTQPELFRAGQAVLDTRLGLGLTLALVTSGWLVAEGVHAYREQRYARTRRFYLGAIGAGLVFVGLKLADFSAKLAAGHGLGVNDFWDAYTLATGFHFVHVLAGLVLLALTGLRAGRARFEDAETAIAGVALFWHMCDLVWFFLFPLFFARLA